MSRPSFHSGSTLPAFVSCVALAALVSGLGGCSSDEEATAGGALPPPPAECASLPTLAAIAPRLRASLDEGARDATPLDLKSGYRAPQIPLSVGYALDGTGPDGIVVPGTEPLLVRSREEVLANEYLKNSVDDFDVDWSSEAILVFREHEREALYRYVVRGTEVVVLVARATPCLAPLDAASFSLGREKIRVFRVPNTVVSARAQATEERYRLVSPKATNTCRRADAPAALGGGMPSIARGPEGLRLYFGGFSAMTGNVFYGASNDGAIFTPNGWDEAHLSRFEGRGPYADVYEPFVEHLGDRWRMTASTQDNDYVREGARTTPVTISKIVEMTSPDGLTWSAGKELVPSSKDLEPARSSPSRISAFGEDRLYYSLDGSIRVARRRGDAPFVEEESPALVPPSDLDAYDAHGYGAPEIAKVGSRFVLFFTARWGGLGRSASWRAAIGYAVSDDGLTFQRGAAPLLVPESEAEANGVGSPAALVEGESVTLFYSAVNRHAEPVVGRAACVVP